MTTIFGEYLLMNKEHTILIAGVQNLVAETFQQALNSYHGFRVIALDRNLTDMAQTMTSLEPEIVLLDQRLLMDGSYDTAANILLRLRMEHPSSRMILLIDDYHEDFIVRALQAGVKGYLSKDAGISQLVNSVQAVIKGEIWAERRLLALCLDQYTKPFQQARNTNPPGWKNRLTPREQEVLEHLTNGCSNRKIAEQLFISEKTVKTHLYNLFRKLKVTDRLQATLYAFQKNGGAADSTEKKD
ncbi:MAG: response regulator transcription factor [Desulfohalobiaceae bacterium]|nr:response regulator transcription factor [Desulfohalobiaceae bacterium]